MPLDLAHHCYAFVLRSSLVEMREEVKLLNTHFHVVFHFIMERCLFLRQASIIGAESLPESSTTTQKSEDQQQLEECIRIRPCILADFPLMIPFIPCSQSLPAPSMEKLPGHEAIARRFAAQKLNPIKHKFSTKKKDLKNPIFSSSEDVAASPLGLLPKKVSTLPPVLRFGGKYRRLPQTPPYIPLILCGLCALYFPKNQNSGKTIVRSKIQELQGRWGIVFSHSRRFQTPSYLYATVPVCLLCFHMLSSKCTDVSRDGIGEMIYASLDHHTVERQVKSSSKINLAQGHPVMQSSTEGGQEATLAVNGDSTGYAAFASTTCRELQPWWQVDLERIEELGTSPPPFAIYQIQLLNFIFVNLESITIYHINTSQRVLNGVPFWILVSAEKPYTEDMSLSEARQLSTNTKKIISLDRKMRWTLPEGSIGRFIRIQGCKVTSLQLSQVDVKGADDRGHPVQLSPVRIIQRLPVRKQPRKPRKALPLKLVLSDNNQQEKGIGRVRPSSAGLLGPTACSQARHANGRERRLKLAQQLQHCEKVTSEEPAHERRPQSAHGFRSQYIEEDHLSRRHRPHSASNTSRCLARSQTFSPEKKSVEKPKVFQRPKSASHIRFEKKIVQRPSSASVARQNLIREQYSSEVDVQLPPLLHRRSFR